MGIANVIPGVSGGTIALVGGVYEDIFASLKGINTKFINAVLRGKFREAFRQVNGFFLGVLFLGVALGILLLANVLSGLLCTYPKQVNALFFGLILASVYSVGKRISGHSLLSILLFLAGTGFALGIGFLPPMNGSNDFIFMVLCGIVAACSMVLPGLSGSYVLLLMGAYATVVKAVTDLQLSILLPLALGAGIGLLGLTRVIALLFERAKRETLSLMAGFVLGSLYVIWPWKQEIYKKNAMGEVLDKHGEVTNNICEDGLVVNYDRWIPSSESFSDGSFYVMLGLIVLGIGAVLAVEYLGKERATRVES